MYSTSIKKGRKKVDIKINPIKNVRPSIEFKGVIDKGEKYPNNIII